MNITHVMIKDLETARSRLIADKLTIWLRRLLMGGRRKYILI